MFSPRFSTARQGRARGVAPPRFRESGSSKAVTSTQEPNRTALSHFPLLSWDVVRRTVQDLTEDILALERPNFRQRIKMFSSSASEMSFDSDDSI